MAALRSPAAQATLERRVGNVIRRGGGAARQDLDIVHQTFPRFEQADLNEVNRGTVVVGAVVEQPRADEIGPGGLGRLVAIGPVAGQAVIAAGVDQLQAAAAPVRPLPPPAAGAVGHLIHDRVNLIGASEGHGHGQGEAGAAVWQMPRIIAHRIQRVQVRVSRPQVGPVACQHQVAVRRQQAVGGHRKHAVLRQTAQPPPSDINRIGALVVQLYEPVVVIARDRVVHDFVDDNVPEQDGRIRGARRGRCQGVKVIGAIGPAAVGNPQELGLAGDRIQNAGPLRVFEIDRLPGRAQAEAQLGLSEGQEPAGGQEGGGIGRDDELVRVRVVRQHTA